MRIFHHHCSLRNRHVASVLGPSCVQVILIWCDSYVEKKENINFATQTLILERNGIIPEQSRGEFLIISLYSTETRCSALPWMIESSDSLASSYLTLSAIKSAEILRTTHSKRRFCLLACAHLHFCFITFQWWLYCVGLFTHTYSYAKYA